MKLKIPPPVYALIFLFVMWFGAERLPLIQWRSPIFPVLSIIFLTLGIILDASSVFRFIVNRTTINPVKPQNSKKLITNGLYAYTRNPMYLGLLMILAGYACYLSSLIAFLLLPVFMWVLTIMQIKPEEKILEKLFKDEYLQYKKKVRRWL